MADADRTLQLHHECLSLGVFMMEIMGKARELSSGLAGIRCSVPSEKDRGYKGRQGVVINLILRCPRIARRCYLQSYPHPLTIVLHPQFSSTFGGPDIPNCLFPCLHSTRHSPRAYLQTMTLPAFPEEVEVEAEVSVTPLSLFALSRISL